ncbi:MAG: hypothetical protein RSB95_04040, partial [Bacilli bacterium]
MSKKQKDVEDNFEVVEDNVKPKVKKIKKKHYWWRYLSVFVFGILFTVVSVVGSVYFISISTVSKDLLGLFGVNSSQFLTEKYGNKTIFEIVTDITSGKVKFNTLGGISELTPIVGDALKTVNGLLKDNLGYEFDVEKLYKVDLANIGDYLFTTLKNEMTIPGLLKVSPNSEKILQYLAYNTLPDGSPDVAHPRTLNDLLNGMDGIIKGVTLGSVVDVGTSGILYNLRDTKVTELATKMNTLKVSEIIEITPESPLALKFLGNYNLKTLPNAFNEAKLGDLIDVGTSGILFNLKNSLLNNINTDVNNLQLKNIIDIQPGSYPALVYLGDFKTSEFDAALNNATLGQLIKVTEADTILWPLKDKKINEINNGVQDLTLGTVITIDASSSKILLSLKDTPIKDIGTKINILTLKDVITIDASSSKIMQSLADAKITDMDATISRLTLSQMVDTSSSRILGALAGATLATLGTTVNNLTLGDAIDTAAPGTPGILVALSGKKITELGTEINKLTMRDILGITDASPIMLQSIANSTLTSIGTDIDNLTIGQVIKIDATSPLILKSLADKNVKINELGTALYTLKISEMIDTTAASTPLILKALSGATLNTLSTTITNLTIGQVIEVGDNKFLKAIPATTKISEMGTALNNLKFVDVFHAEIYDTNGNIKSTWKYLLRE